MDTVTREQVSAEFDARLAALLAATEASRVTLRLDVPALGFHVDDVAAEALEPGVASLRGQTGIDQRRAGTVVWLERERRALIQEDLAGADPAPPPELVATYGTKAQMLGPLVRDGELVGWISVHDNRGPRRWRPADVQALEAAAAWFTDRVDRLPRTAGKPDRLRR